MNPCSKAAESKHNQYSTEKIQILGNIKNWYFLAETTEAWYLYVM